MSGEVETSQAEVDLKALEDFLVGYQDLERLDALLDNSTSSRPPDGTGDGHEDEGCQRIQAPQLIKQDEDGEFYQQETRSER